MDTIAPSQTAISAFPSRLQDGSPRQPVFACDTCFAEPPLEAAKNIWETGSGFRKRSRMAGGAQATPPAFGATVAVNAIASPSTDHAKRSGEPAISVSA